MTNQQKLLFLLRELESLDYMIDFDKIIMVTESLIDLANRLSKIDFVIQANARQLLAVRSKIHHLTYQRGKLINYGGWLAFSTIVDHEQHTKLTKEIDSLLLEARKIEEYILNIIGDFQPKLQANVYILLANSSNMELNQFIIEHINTKNNKKLKEITSNIIGYNRKARLIFISLKDYNGVGDVLFNAANSLILLNVKYKIRSFFYLIYSYCFAKFLGNQSLLRKVKDALIKLLTGQMNRPRGKRFR